MPSWAAPQLKQGEPRYPSNGPAEAALVSNNMLATTATNRIELKRAIRMGSSLATELATLRRACHTQAG